MDKEIEWSFSEEHFSKLSVEIMATALPGARVMVERPCGCAFSEQEMLFMVVIHLNDTHNDSFNLTGWPREKIADWIDKLHDDGVINAEFSPWEETA